jgi:prepilin-type N-terminal cleavage/methylation domain-containing protein
MVKMNKKGVTLLELIIVMVIIAIGATLLVPGIGTWIPIYRLRGATRDVVSTMRTAQMKAISINTDYQVNFLNATTYVLEYKNTLGNFVAEGSQQTLPKGIEFTTFPRIFRFNPNSTAWISGGLIIKNTKGSTRTITLSTSTGKIIVDPPL